MARPRLLETISRYSRSRRGVTPTKQPSGQNATILYSFPKSGNTWVRFILANTFNLIENRVDKVDFHNIHELLPSLEDETHSKFAGFPRILKTHSAYQSSFEKVVMILRHPYDVFYSYYHFLNQDRQIARTMKELIHDSQQGIQGMVDATQSYLASSTNLFIISYEDLMTDPFPSLKRLFHFLDLEIAETVIQQGHRLSSFDNMRSVEEERGRKFGNTNFKFTRNGTIGEGASQLTDQDKSAIRQVIRNSPLLDLYYRASL